VKDTSESLQACRLKALEICVMALHREVRAGLADPRRKKRGRRSAAVVELPESRGL